MLSKFVIFCFIHVFRIFIEANDAPEKTVQIPQSQLDDLNTKQDELIKLKQQYESEQQTWQNDKKKLQDENKKLQDEVNNLKEDFEPMERKTWTLMWFRWLTMIKNEIEWRETVLTDFTFDRKQFEEEKSKNKLLTEKQEYRRQVWNQILGNCSDNTHIIALVHEINKAGVEKKEFSYSMAIAYDEITSKLLSMMRWRNLPKFEKEPTFNTPVTWSAQANKCLSILMFDIDIYVAWNFKTELPMDQTVVDH